MDKLLAVGRKILDEIDDADYGEGELKDGSYELLKNAVAEAEAGGAESDAKERRRHALLQAAAVIAAATRIDAPVAVNIAEKILAVIEEREG